MRFKGKRVMYLQIIFVFEAVYSELAVCCPDCSGFSRWIYSSRGSVLADRLDCTENDQGSGVPCALVDFAGISPLPFKLFGIWLAGALLFGPFMAGNIALFGGASVIRDFCPLLHALHVAFEFQAAFRSFCAEKECDSPKFT